MVGSLFWIAGLLLASATPGVPPSDSTSCATAGERPAVSCAPVDTTSSTPVDTTSSAPVGTTSSAPVDTTSSTPVGTTSSTPVGTPAPVPVGTASSAPVGTPAPVPVEVPVLVRAQLDTTIVTGRRPKPAARLHRESSFASRIELPADRAAGETIADVIERTVGVMVQRYGGPGAMATVSIRGADPGDVEVYLDRVPLRTAARGMVDLSSLDMASLAALEIYRSAPPDGMGGEFAGSALRLITRQGGPASLAWRSDGGSLDTWRHEAVLGGSYRQGRFLLTGSRFSTRGNFTYHDDNGTPANPDDDRWKEWANGDVLRESLLARWTQAAGRLGTVDFASQFWRADQGLPGSDRQPTARSRLRSRGGLHRIETETHRRLLPVRLTLQAFLHQEELHYRDPERELAVPGASATRADQDLDRWGYGLHLHKTLRGAHHRPWGYHALELTANRRHERLRNAPLPGRSEEDTRERASTAFSAGDRIEWAAGRFHADIFYRWNHTCDNYTGANPYQPFASQPERTTRVHGAHLGLRASAGGGHTFRANYADQARFPTFVELFGYAGTIRSNPQLRPETGWRADTGWQWDWPVRPWGMRLRTEAAGYVSRREEMIVLIRISERETKPVNLDRASLRGLELSWQCATLPGLRGKAPLASIERAIGELFGAAAARSPVAQRTGEERSATLFGHLHWQQTRDEGAARLYQGKALTYHPPWQLLLGLTWPQGHWDVRYIAQFRDEAYWSRSNLPEYRTGATWLHELQLAWRPAPQGGLSIRIENLFGTRSQDVRGYPLPGRTWFAGIEIDPLRTQ